MPPPILSNFPPTYLHVRHYLPLNITNSPPNSNPESPQSHEPPARYIIETDIPLARRPSPKSPSSNCLYIFLPRRSRYGCRSLRYHSHWWTCGFRCLQVHVGPTKCRSSSSLDTLCKLKDWELGARSNEWIYTNVKF